MKRDIILLMSFWGFFFFIFNYWLSFFFIVIISLPDGISRAFSSLLSTCLPTDIVEFYVLCATPLLVSPLFALCSSYHFPRDQVSMLTPGGEFDEQSKARRPLPCRRNPLLLWVNFAAVGALECGDGQLSVSTHILIDLYLIVDFYCHCHCHCPL
jgi:hypothetical protein